MENETQKQTGTVKWFSSEKGYGFIAPENGGNDIFVHSSDVPEGVSLNEGTRVEFNVGEGPKGLNAIDVAVLA